MDLMPRFHGSLSFWRFQDNVKKRKQENNNNNNNDNSDKHYLAFKASPFISSIEALVLKPVGLNEVLLLEILLE